MDEIEFGTIDDKYPYTLIHVAPDTQPLRAGTVGWTCGPVILIREPYGFDKGLIAHEKHHLKRWYERGGTCHRTIEESAVEELECMAIQLQIYKEDSSEDFEKCFDELCNDLIVFYKISKSMEQSRTLLQDALNKLNFGA